jgi:uncharacterized protein DUF1488
MEVTVPLHRMDHGVSPHHQPDGIIFWMADDRGAPVRVLITKDALHTELDNNTLPAEQFSGLQIFDAHRDRIEQAASRKFDAKGVTDHLDGKAVLIVYSADL